MNYKTKPECPFDSLNIYIHEKCLILNIKDENRMVKFEEAELMMVELNRYLDPLYVEHMKDYIMDNCDKEKFKNKEDIKDQLSLF